MGAVAIVALALAARSAIDDGSGGGPPGGDGADVAVVCDVTSACTGLEGSDARDEAGAVTAAALSAGNGRDIDVWVTTSAWWEVVEARAPGVLGEPVALGTSPVAVAALPGRGEALESACRAEPLLRCLGTSAGRPWSELSGQGSWGRLAVGLPDPDLGTGLSILAAAASDWFGGTDFARNDFEVDPEFRPWLERLYSERPVTSPVRTMVTAQGMFSVAVDTAIGVEVGAGQRPVDRLEPGQPAQVTLLAVPVGGTIDDEVLATLRRAVEDAGWDAAAPGPVTPTLRPGVMAALHDLWTEAAR